ncbi:MAG: hypothetical protein J5725_02035 [Bacteroidales bacterium]|nr:hypothetical protein [Bacteroidales bacterium]
MTDEIILEEENEENNPVVEDNPTPTPPTMFDKVKLALRISHNLLDGEIADVITSARSELARAGVDSTLAQSDEELIQTAIKTYALAYYSSDVKDSERFNQSFTYQCDCLRKSTFTENEDV